MTIEDSLSLAGTLVAGLSIGWLIRSRAAIRQAKRFASTSAHNRLNPYQQITHNSLALSYQLEETRTAIAARKKELQKHDGELGQATTQLKEYQQELDDLHDRLNEQKERHASLQTQLGERRGQIAKVSADLYRLEQEIIRRKEEKTISIGMVQERNHELEMLAQITAGYETDVDELTQAIQLTDGEILRLKSVLQSKEKELAEANTLLKQRDADLTNLIKERKETEHKIAQSKEHLGLLAREHDRLLDQLRIIAEDTDQRARLLLALQNEGHPDAGPLRDDVGYPDPDGIQYKQIRALPAPTDKGDDLTAIKGIGDGYASLLKAAGVYTFDDLAALTPQHMRQIFEGPQWRTPDVESWIAEARALASKQDDEFDYDTENAIEVDYKSDIIDDDDELDGADRDFMQGLIDWDDDAPEE